MFFPPPLSLDPLKEKKKNFSAYLRNTGLRKITCKKSLLLIFLLKKQRARLIMDCNYLHKEISYNYNPCFSTKTSNFQRPNQKKILKNA